MSSSSSDTRQQKSVPAPAVGTSGGEIVGILTAGALALPAVLAYFAAMPPHFQRWLALDDKLAVDPAYRLMFTLRWLAPVCLLVVLFTQAVAACRLFSPAIDGRTPHRLTDLWRSILQNTVEQALTLTLNLLALSQNLRPERLVLVPMLVALFVVARIIFAVGYLIWPTRRALGFALTFGPNVAMSVYNVYCLARF